MLVEVYILFVKKYFLIEIFDYLVYKIFNQMNWTVAFVYFQQSDFHHFIIST